MYKMYLSLAFSPQTETWGKTRGKQNCYLFQHVVHSKLTAAAHLAQNLWTIMMRLTRSTWNPSPTFKESRLDSDEGQHYGDPSLRLPGSQLVQSEVRRVGLGLATPLKAWHLAHDLFFFLLGRNFTPKKPKPPSKAEWEFTAVFFGGEGLSEVSRCPFRPVFVRVARQ